MVITSEAHVARQQLSLDVYCPRQTSAANPSVAAAVDRRDRQTDTRPFYKTLYDTIRDAILTCARKPTRVSLIYRTEPTTKKCKTEKKRICSEVSENSLGNPYSQS